VTPAFTLVFLCFLTATVAAKLWLVWRQARFVSRHRPQVPAQFADRVPLASHQKAADYTLAKLKLALVDIVFGAAVLVVLTLMGGIDLLNGWIQGMIASDLWAGAALILGVVVITAALDLPLEWYRQFRLEARFGFNKMTLGLFVGDLLKSAALMLALGTPLLLAILWLMAKAGPWWWLYAWGVWAVFNLAMIALYPTFIAPLFNKFSPLADEELGQRIERLAQRTGFALKGLFVMDGSKRSAHGNAYFTGLGRGKRIVFFDTLLERLEHGEIEAVLAHELGHFKHRHIVKRIALLFGLSLGFFALLGYLANQPWFYAGLGATPSLERSNDALALLLIFLATPVFTFFFAPLGSLMSRRHEFEADAFAAQQTRADDLVSALVKLYDDNASTLTTDPVYSTFYDSHPPAAVRIQRLLHA
jgi:STE24 endopeptidase